MSDNPLKVIQVSGTLPPNGNGRFDFRVFPDYFNVYNGTWEIAVSDVTITGPKGPLVISPPHFICIKTNVVLGECTESFNRAPLPMQNFMLPGHQDMLFNFPQPKWFQINSPSHNFEAYTERYANKTDLFGNDLKCDITFLLRKIR